MGPNLLQGASLDVSIQQTYHIRPQIINCRNVDFMASQEASRSVESQTTHNYLLFHAKHFAPALLPPQ